MVYITVPDPETALTLARGAVQQQLAACANILPGMNSVYQWNGALEEATELVLLLKTARPHLSALEQWIREHHPYEVPCMLEIPITGGYQPYLEWLRAGLREGPLR